MMSYYNLLIFLESLLELFKVHDSFGFCVGLLQNTSQVPNTKCVILFLQLHNELHVDSLDLYFDTDAVQLRDFCVHFFIN